MFRYIINFLNDFFTEMLKYKTISCLMMFLYISVIFIIFSVVSLYNDVKINQDKIYILEHPVLESDSDDIFVDTLKY